MSILLPLVAYVDLSKGKQAIVDWFDLEWISQHKWYFKEAADGTGGYAARIDLTGGKRTLITMHRAVFLKHNACFDFKDVENVDHINRQKLDNRLSNLRAATKRENIANAGVSKSNKSGYKGVNYYPQSSSYKAQIMEFGKKKHIGYYATPEEAALAYNIRSREIFGEFAYQNPIPDGLTEAKKLNSSRACQPFKGVSFRKDTGKFSAYIDVNNRRKHLGYFKTESEALNAVESAQQAQFL